MNTTDEMISCLQAYKEGKQVERKMKGVPMAKWYLCETSQHFAFNFDDYEYRVKREPREVWVNEFDDGSMSEPFQTAEDAVSDAAWWNQYRCIKTIKFREVLDD
mgnify:FL=1